MEKPTFTLSTTEKYFSEIPMELRSGWEFGEEESYRNDQDYDNKNGRTTNLLRDKAAYILELAEMDGAHGLPRDTDSLTYEMKQFIHFVDKTKIVNNITPKPAFKYARRVILG